MLLNSIPAKWVLFFKRKKLIQKYPRGGKPLGIFSHAFFAHVGTVYKHPPTVSSRFFSQSRTRSTLLSQKTSFLVLGHFYAVPLVVALTRWGTAYKARDTVCASLRRQMKVFCDKTIFRAQCYFAKHFAPSFLGANPTRFAVVFPLVLRQVVKYCALAFAAKLHPFPS